MNWISHKNSPPQPGTKVWYYFELTGVSQGEYHGDNCYGGKRGFLCDDVTHWQYDVGQDKPESPNELD